MTLPHCWVTSTAASRAYDVAEPLESLPRRGQSQVAVLVYSSADRINAGGQRTVALTMKDLPFDRAMSVLQDRWTDGDVFRTWKAWGHRPPNR